MELYNGDCLQIMKQIPNESVDMVLCDLPYGTTECKWDIPINLEILWNEYKRVCKKNACIALFSQMPFTADLVNSNRKMFRYEWIYKKTMATGFLNAKKMPLKAHENILIFYNKLPTYNPQKTKGKPYTQTRYTASENYKAQGLSQTVNLTGDRYPLDVIEFKNSGWKRYHSTQKPVELCEYLIKTYTNEGETVLDNTMGSGTTGVACINTNRNFIGIEKSEEYFAIAKNRILERRNILENSSGSM